MMLAHVLQIYAIIDTASQASITSNSPKVARYLFGADDIAFYYYQMPKKDASSFYERTDDFANTKRGFIDQNFVIRDTYARKVQKCFPNIYPIAV